MLTAPGYRLTLSKQNGEVLELVDRRTGERMLRGQNGCWWAAKQTTGEAASGCAFGRTGDNRFTFRWSQLTSTLTMSYDSAPAGPGVDAVVTLVARSAAFDVRLELDSSVEYPLSTALFPTDLLLPAADVRGRVHADVPARHPPASQLLQRPPPQRRDLPVALGVRGLPLGRYRQGAHRDVLDQPGAAGHRAGRHRLRPSRRGSGLRRPVLLRDARLPDLGRARPEVGEPAGQGARRRHRGAVAVRLPRGQRHRQVPVARGKGRLQARQARTLAADQGRPLERTARVQPVGGVAEAVAVACAHPSGGVPVGRVRRERIRTSCRPIHAGARAPTSTAWPSARGRSGNSSCRT